MSTLLLRKMLRGTALFPAASVKHVLHWSNYSAKSVALIQARGIPIDVPLWNLVQENKAAVIGELLRQFDPSYGDDDPIYSPDGEWEYARFERWLIRSGVPAWPRLESGALDISGDAFELMYHVPGVEGLHALRTASVSLPRQDFRLVEMGVTDRPYSRSEQQPVAMLTLEVRTMHMPACVRSSCFRPIPSGCIWIGERKKSA